jgi:phage portal protein BeeE
VVDAQQSEFIRKNVYNYFGTNEHILQNNFGENEWAAYYEGKVEPLLIQLSQALTRLLFTDREIASGNYILFESIRLQHADIKTKWAVASGGVDRGLLTINEAREMMNFPPVDGGDVRMIRKDFTNADEAESEQEDDNTES